MRLASAVLALLFALVPFSANAHCDRADGPVVLDAKRALETGNAALLLRWVPSAAEPELRGVFDLARKVRGTSAEARELAERHLFDTAIRLHRAGEGEPFTGLVEGGEMPEAVRMADEALESGKLAKLEETLAHGLQHGLHERFEKARAARAAADGSVEEGRHFVHDYVEFVRFAERVEAALHGAAHH